MGYSFNSGRSVLGGFSGGDGSAAEFRGGVERGAGGGCSGCLVSAGCDSGECSRQRYDVLARQVRQNGMAPELLPRIGRYGGVAAFLCFLPLLGDGFAIALGFMRYPAGRFFGLMALGKLLRYLVWIILHQAVAA